ncbi:ATP-binding protein [Candidatus Cloacimonadota bacterium]
MAEYWYARPEWEAEIKKFFNLGQKPNYTQEFEILEKDFINTGKASADTKLLLKRLGVQATVLRRVAIIGYEAEINITAHAKGGKMVCDIYPDLIHIRFYDKGPGIKDIEQSMTPGFSTADQQVREFGFGAGLGLPNIKKNTDMMHIISQENANTFLEIIVFFKENE